MQATIQISKYCLKVSTRKVTCSWYYNKVYISGKEVLFKGSSKQEMNLHLVVWVLVGYSLIVVLHVGQHKA